MRKINKCFFYGLVLPWIGGLAFVAAYFFMTLIEQDLLLLRHILL